MVDHQSYFQYGPSAARNGALEPSMVEWTCTCTDCQGNKGLSERYRTRFDTIRTPKLWEDEKYLLCPPRVLGYILEDKQWAQLQVTQVTQIPPDDPANAWNSRLQLAEDDTKKLLFNLVRSHVSTRPKKRVSRKSQDHKLLEVDDIVPGKGKGLVILLYGMITANLYTISKWY